MNCKVKITTTQSDYKGMSIFDCAVKELMMNETISDYTEGDIIETTLFGEFSTQGGKFTLSYDEESEYMGATHTKVEFSLAEPNLISIVRGGAVESFMVFEKHKRNICVYNTGILPFDICIFTKEITNQLLEKGYLELDYIIEIKGACAQHTVMKMEVTRL
ncbi:MAG: DUF1934 domain-containing protein [Clostridia bacterium]|nr:DUF1934 domain-containing protein [Clostridia bacterium]